MVVEQNKSLVCNVNLALVITINGLTEQYTRTRCTIVWLIGQFVIVLCMLHVNSRGDRRHYYNMTVHTCRAQTQACPLSQYDWKVLGKPLIIGMYGMYFGERVIYHIIMYMSLDHTVHVAMCVSNCAPTLTWWQWKQATSKSFFSAWCHCIRRIGWDRCCLGVLNKVMVF